MINQENNKKSQHYSPYCNRVRLDENSVSYKLGMTQKCKFCETKKSCIYLLEETESGYFYVGKTNNFKQRKYSHLASIQNCNHKNKKIKKFCDDNKGKKQKWRMIKLIQIDDYVPEDFVNLLENRMMFSFFIERQGKCLNNFMINKDMPSPEQLFGQCLKEFITDRLLDAVAQTCLVGGWCSKEDILNYLRQEADKPQDRSDIENLINKLYS